MRCPQNQISYDLWSKKDLYVGGLVGTFQFSTCVIQTGNREFFD